MIQIVIDHSSIGTFTLTQIPKEPDIEIIIRDHDCERKYPNLVIDHAEDVYEEIKLTN